MNRNIIRLFAAAIALSMMLLLCSCMVVHLPARTQEENDSVTVSPIKNIDVNWVSGSVNIIRADVKEISVSESCDKELKDSEKMVYSIKGDTLRVDFCEPSIINIFNTDKDLEITLPASVADELKSVDIENVSAAVSIGGISCKTIDLTTVSGDVDVDESSCSKLDIETVSGNIRYAGNVLDEVDADSVSGSVTLDLPDDAGFSAEISSMSGRITSDIPATSHDGRYVAGDGYTDIELNSVSGDLILQ